MSQEVLARGDDLSAPLRSLETKLPNISIEYMYRDAGNFKRFEIVSFANTQRITAAEIWRQVNEILEGLMLFPEQPIFRPEWVGLPTVFLFGQPGCSRNDDDHDWHEVIAVKETDSPPTFGEGSEISNFIDALRRTHLNSV
jgi:hypothetical protein